MTYQQIIDFANVKVDSYGNPFFDTPRSCLLLYDAILEFVWRNYEKFEKDERARENLIGLVKFAPVSKNLKSGYYELNTLTDLMYVLSDVYYILNGVRVNIKPNRIGKTNVMLSDDPFIKPTDRYPRYDQYGNTGLNYLILYMDNTPSTITVSYIARPSQPTSTNVSSGAPETNVETHIEIGKILATMMMLAIEDYNRIQLEQNEIAITHVPN